MNSKDVFMMKVFFSIVISILLLVLIYLTTKYFLKRSAILKQKQDSLAIYHINKDKNKYLTFIRLLSHDRSIRCFVFRRYTLENISTIDLITSKIEECGNLYIKSIEGRAYIHYLVSIRYSIIQYTFRCYEEDVIYLRLVDQTKYLIRIQRSREFLYLLALEENKPINITEVKYSLLAGLDSLTIIYKLVIQGIKLYKKDICLKKCEDLLNELESCKTYYRNIDQIYGKEKLFKNCIKGVIGESLIRYCVLFDKYTACVF